MDNINFKAIKPDLTKIVQAIEKAIGPDTREFISTHQLATNNSRCFLRGDFINTNLRVMLPEMEIHSFPRSSWEGQLLIDRVHQVTYNVLADQTLKKIPKVTDRHRPHYLQSILHTENAGVKPLYKPIDLFEGEGIASSFCDSEYLQDYHNIMGERLSSEDKYLHIVISYTAKQGELLSVMAKILTPNFAIAAQYSLMNLLRPDFIDLTEDFVQAEKPQDIHDLVSVKPAVAKLKEQEQTQKLISVKERREKKQVP